MALTTIATATDILNRVAAEVGVQPVESPYFSSDPKFKQFTFLLNTAGEELSWAYPWEQLQKTHTFTTQPADSGGYPIPDDFLYLINQTTWDLTNTLPLGGPLSPQEWTYLKGRNLAQNTIYASFRLTQGLFHVYPDPPPAGLTLSYEYIAKNWVLDSQTGTDFVDSVSFGEDKPLFDKTLISRYLKLKYLESSGFDTKKAQDDFNQTFSFQTGKDKSAPIVNAGTSSRAYPYISIHNVPDTGFGI